MGLLDFGKKEKMAPLSEHLTAGKPAFEWGNMPAQRSVSAPPVEPADAPTSAGAPVDDSPQAGGVVVVDVKKRLSQLTRKAKSGKRKIVADVLDLGCTIAEARDLLANHSGGSFGKWCKQIGMSRMSAHNYASIFDAFGSCTKNVQLNFDAQAVRLLASSKSPPAIGEAIELADEGKPVDAQVAKQLIGKHAVLREKTVRALPTIISTEFGSVAIHCKPGASERDLVAAVLKQLLDGERKVA